MRILKFAIICFQFLLRNRRLTVVEKWAERNPYAMNKFLEFFCNVLLRSFIKMSNFAIVPS